MTTNYNEREPMRYTERQLANQKTWMRDHHIPPANIKISGAKQTLCATQSWCSWEVTTKHRKYLFEIIVDLSNDKVIKEYIKDYDEAVPRREFIPRIVLSAEVKGAFNSIKRDFKRAFDYFDDGSPFLYFRQEKFNAP